MLLADFEGNVNCQMEVDKAHADRENWSRKSILNTARSGKFSSDRTIREYCRDVWKMQPVPIAMPNTFAFAL